MESFQTLRTQLATSKKRIIIDPFNKSNIHSFPLLATYSAFEILLKSVSFNDVNSGKLYILDLLKGTIIINFGRLLKWYHLQMKS